MTSGVLKLVDWNDKVIRQRTYYDITMRKKILNDWSKLYGKGLNNLFIHIVPDFDDELYDDQGRLITNASKRKEYIKKYYRGNVAEMCLKLGLSEFGVRNILSGLGVGEVNRANNEQKKFIKDNYKTLTAKQIREELNISINWVYYYINLYKKQSEPPVDVKEEKPQRHKGVYSNPRLYDNV